jgi:hypothetical protein
METTNNNIIFAKDDVRLIRVFTKALIFSAKKLMMWCGGRWRGLKIIRGNSN